MATPVKWSLDGACYVWGFLSISSKNRTRQSMYCTLYYYNKTSIRTDFIFIQIAYISNPLCHTHCFYLCI